jgi:hypothetical protein
MGILRDFLSSSGGDVRASEIGIVTPYSAQVRLIKERCCCSPFVEVEVASVDGFQGREKQVIIFSCVRANASGNLGFLADPRRVNVMMTRAKRGLVIVGSPLTLLAERGTWAPWLLWAHQNGLIVGGAPANFFSDLGITAAPLLPDSHCGRSRNENPRARDDRSRSRSRSRDDRRSRRHRRRSESPGNDDRSTNLDRVREHGSKSRNENPKI